MTVIVVLASLVVPAAIYGAVAFGVVYFAVRLAIRHEARRKA